MTNESLNTLKNKIANSGYKVAYIADQMEISRPALLNRLNGRYSFRVTEANVLRNLLRLSDEETLQIFFDRKG